MAILSCPNCEYEVTVHKVTYCKDGKVFKVNKVCPNCGTALVEEPSFINESALEGFEVSRWGSMGEKEKRQVIKDRARRHYNNVDRKEVEHKRDETIKNIKQQFEKGKQK